MVIATTLPSKRVTLRFPPHSDDTAEDSYQLLELPAEILKQIEGQDAALSLTIKGRPSDDAVLCTPTNTYALRSVGISNSLLVCRPPDAAKTPLGSNGGETLEIRDASHEIMELVPQAPAVERIRKLLQPSAWRGMGTELEGEPSSKRRKLTGGAGEVGKGKEGRMYTMDQMRSVVQASEAELQKGLRERNVVEINGRLLMLPPKALAPLLIIVLNLLTIHADTTDVCSGTASCPSKPILESLCDDHEVPSEVASGMMKLFSASKSATSTGRDEDGARDADVDVAWTADVKAMVRIIGLGQLEELRQPEAVDRFEYRWREVVGDWGDVVDVKALAGNYLLTAPPASILSNPTHLISHFPAHTLPSAPAVRFSDLFLTRTPWKPEDMEPFLADLYREGDSKERDKLVAKFVRVVKDKTGVWWYPRRSG